MTAMTDITARGGRYETATSNSTRCVSDAWQRDDTPPLIWFTIKIRCRTAEQTRTAILCRCAIHATRSSMAGAVKISEGDLIGKRPGASRAKTAKSKG